MRFLVIVSGVAIGWLMSQTDATPAYGAVFATASCVYASLMFRPCRLALYRLTQRMVVSYDATIKQTAIWAVLAGRAVATAWLMNRAAEAHAPGLWALAGAVASATLILFTLQERGEIGIF